ncbi:MAG TPA: M48 family metalloprotease [Thermodesulfobacteriota bacterium]|nr:M48 family metalloprotease [Deltaproteobacteria bacterium]HNR11685.1 M48 family metalloprotease [Thermodesulfobacteriota bacterium]
MSYTNLIYFALALLVYFTYVPHGKGSIFQALSFFLAVTAAFHAFTWLAYLSVRKKIATASVSFGRIFMLTNSLEQRFVLLALCFHLFLIYSSGIKEVFWRFPLLEKSATIDLVAGLSPFILMLLILWFNASRVVREASEVVVSRSGYVWAQVKMNAPIILPAFLFSMFLDLISFALGSDRMSAAMASALESLLFIPFVLLLVCLYPLVLRYAWGCYPLPPGEQRSAIESFCRKAGLRISNIFVWPAFQGKSLTAGIAGVLSKLRYLFITPGLLNLLTEPELESVVAHEAGHIRKRHVAYYVIVFLLLPFSLFLVQDLLLLLAYGFDDLIPVPAAIEEADSSLASLSLLLIVGSIMFLYLRVFFGLLSRNFEREADLFVFEVVGHPFHLIASLEKIACFGGHSKSAPSWHHYGIGERIRFLQECNQDRFQLRRHESKVRTIKRLLAAVFFAIVFLVVTLQTPQVRQPLESALLDSRIERLLKNQGENPEVLVGVATILQQQRRDQKAEVFYQRALAIEPDNEMALNNLAWLYATTKDQDLKNEEKALELALRASRIKPEAYILDTLAEAYWVNGMREEALAASEAALAADPENREYYEKQRKKFAESQEPH